MTVKQKHTSCSLWLQIGTMGFAGYLTFYAVVSQTNFWAYFYSKQFVVILSFVFAIAEMLGSFAGVIVEQKFTANTIAITHIIISMVSITAFLPLSFIPNLIARKILVSVPLFTSAFSAGIFFPLIIGCAAKIDQNLTTGVTLGVGLSLALTQGVEDVISIVFDSTGQSDEKVRNLLFWNALCYYATAFVFFVVALIVWIRLYNQYKTLFNNMNKSEVEIQQNTEQQDDLIIEGQSSQPNDRIESQQGTSEFLGGDTEQQTVKHQNQTQQPKRISVLRKVTPISVPLGISYFIAALVFPLFVINVPSSTLMNKGEPSTNEWWVLALLSVYQLSDFIGRVLPLFPCIIKRVSYNMVIVLGYFRIIYLVLCPLISVVPKGYSIPLICNDIVSFIVIITCAFTTSFSMTTGYVRYQDNLTKNEVQKGSFLLNLFLEVGLLSGALISLPGTLLFEN